MINLDLWRSLNFAHPERLLLLALPVLLMMWELGRRGPRIALPLDHRKHGESRWLARLATMAGLLPAVLLALAIVLLARPLVAGKPKSDRTLTNIEFLLDVSGSMTAQFGDGTRYDAAMRAIDDFTTHREGDAFGLTIFGNEVLRWTPLTQDLSAIRSATPFLRPEDLPHQFGGTEIGKAVLFSREALARRGEGDRLLVLFSDGDSSDLGPARSRSIGMQLAQTKVVIYAIFIGNGSPPSDLYDLCRPTGGAVFPASNPAALTAVFNNIDRMQPVKLKPTAPERIDFLSPFALLGFVGLGLYGLCLFGLRYTPW